MPLDAATAPPALRYAEIVRRMEELLARPENWCQGTAFRGKAMCMIGALDTASPTSEALGPIWQRLDRYVGCGVGIWNDGPARTHADVLDLLARTRRYFEEGA